MRERKSIREVSPRRVGFSQSPTVGHERPPLDALAGRCGLRISIGPGRIFPFLLLISLAVLFVLVASVGSAWAAGPPRMGPGETAVRLPRATQTGAGPFSNRIEPGGLETHWEYDYATSQSGPWTPIPGGASITPASNATQFPIETGPLTGLAPATTYFVRLEADNAAGDLILNGGEVSPLVTEFATAPLWPRVSIVGSAISAVTATTAHVQGAVVPGNFETQWHFEYAPSITGPWTGVAGASGTIPASEADEEFHQVVGTLTGLSPDTNYFVRLFAENEHGEAENSFGERVSVATRDLASFETAGAPTATTFRVDSFDGEALRLLGAVRPHGFDTHFHFEYLTDEEFTNGGGFSGAQTTPEVDAGAGEYRGEEEGFPTKIVGQDLPELRPGVVYDYRVVATSNAPGNPVVRGGTQSLNVPTAPENGPAAACPNEAVRSGPSARLPDCRAYEQVTPADKGGTMDIDTYGGVTNLARVGEDGDHLMLSASGTQWGPSPDSKLSTYSFSRTTSGWQMTSVTPQPEAGADNYVPTLFSPTLTQLGVEVGWSTTPSNSSPELELESGPPGGPYTRVASLPRKDVIAGSGAWIAASADGSKLILRTADANLLGRSTGTTSGTDLYEYSSGQLRQLNVTGPAPGNTIGTCGATMVQGWETYQQTEIQSDPHRSSPHAVSADDSRVFFEATPGSNCSEPTHLYMRVAGAETFDIGPYTFLAANSAGSMLLLERHGGETHEVLLDDTETSAISPLFSLSELPVLGSAQRFIVSEDLSAIYFRSLKQLPGTDAPPISDDSEDLGSVPTNLYRYDLSTETLRFIAQVGSTPGSGGGYSVSPDGRYYYFASTGVAGVPGGSPNVGTQRLGQNSDQLYRFDNTQDIVQCMSCASPFNPAPDLDATFIYGGQVDGNGVPDPTVSSANGDFVFFDTTAALVPADVDGEIPPDVSLSSEHVEFVRSPSSDTYEWRRDGVDDCTAIQGCLSLISGGRGGYKTELLGATPSGRDVFFATHESLVGTDADAAGDIYDARIGGGFPPPRQGPVECEGDACHDPAQAPAEPSLGTSVPSGTGNATPARPPKKKRKPRRAKKHGKRSKAHGRGVK